MLTPLSVIGIIFLTLGIAATIAIILVGSLCKPHWLYGCIISVFFVIVPGLIMILNTPTKQDVFNGNAHYVKEINYQEYDTITTYRIEFNEDYYVGKPATKHNEKSK